MSYLKAPPEEWLVRDCSAKVVEQLKIEMMVNNCSDVQRCIADVMGARRDTIIGQLGETTPVKLSKSY